MSECLGRERVCAWTLCPPKRLGVSSRSQLKLKDYAPRGGVGSWIAAFPISGNEGAVDPGRKINLTQNPKTPVLCIFVFFSEQH